MPAPKRKNVDDFMANLQAEAVPHVQRLRELSLAAATPAGLAEELKWNFPAYTDKVMVWTLQCFKHHCSIRFPVPFFTQYRDEAAAAGYEAIDGALKIRWDQPVPEALVSKLIEARIADFRAGNTAWSEPGQYAGKKKK